MKSPYISDLEPNQVYTAAFLVQHKDVRQKKTGEPYLSLTFSDRTGELDAKMWDNVGEVMDTFSRDDFVKVKGMVQLFQNRLQMTVHKVQRMDEAEIELADFFPASRRDPSAMFGELQGFVAAMTNPHLKALVEAVLADPEIAKRYQRAPAAKTIHHAFLGGLLEHVLSMCHLARFAAAHYPHIDHDLLLTGVVLHDIGKIYELSYERSFLYTTEGHLLGHIMIGVRLAGDKIASLPGFPPKLRTLVEHLILSHHGDLAFGSPKVPVFPEALLLHFLDNLDSKMEAMRANLERDRHLDGEFTTYNSALDRTILKVDRYLEGAPPAPRPKPVNGPAPKQNAERTPSGSVFASKLQQALGKNE